jgi:hypothetical protein
MNPLVMLGLIVAVGTVLIGAGVCLTALLLHLEPRWYRWDAEDKP